MAVYSQETRNWFFETFSPDEVATIDQAWTQRGTLNISTRAIEFPEPLSKTLGRQSQAGQFYDSRWGQYGELNCLAESLTTLLFKEHRFLAERCVTFLLQRDLHPLFAHFYITTLAEFYYAEHEIERAIDYSNMVVAIAPEAAKAFETEGQSLPMHAAYKRLCIIYEKKLDYVEAIKFAEQAKAEGWGGDWDKRIARCRDRESGVAHRAVSTFEYSPVLVEVDGRQIEAHSNLDESNKPYIAIARTYGRSHPICRFCHKEHSALQEGACPTCFDRSHRYRETNRKLTRCVACKVLAPVFEDHFYGICEECFNDRKGAFCTYRKGDATANDGGYPFSGCRGCGEDRLVNGFGYCEECYSGVCAVHPVRLCTQCGQYGLKNHISRESIFAKDHAIEEVWKKDMEFALSDENGGSWPKRYRVAADTCDPCWKANRRARKQKSDLNAVMQGLKKTSSGEKS